MLYMEKLIRLIATYAPLAPDHAPPPPADREFSPVYFTAVNEFLRFIVHAKEAYSAISYLMWLCHGFHHLDESKKLFSAVTEMSANGEKRKLLVIAKHKNLIIAVEKAETKLLLLASHGNGHLILSSGDDVLRKAASFDLLDKTNSLETIYNHPTRGHWFPDFNICQYRYIG